MCEATGTTGIRLATSNGRRAGEFSCTSSTWRSAQTASTSTRYLGEHDLRYLSRTPGGLTVGAKTALARHTVSNRVNFLWNCSRCRDLIRNAADIWADLLTLRIHVASPGVRRWASLVQCVDAKAKGGSDGDGVAHVDRTQPVFHVNRGVFVPGLCVSADALGAPLQAHTAAPGGRGPACRQSRQVVGAGRNGLTIAKGMGKPVVSQLGLSLVDKQDFRPRYKPEPPK